eukprot:SM000043S15842  [mRNA]  locus=s43:465973:471271:- [translate_table: standard]
MDYPTAFGRVPGGPGRKGQGGSLGGAGALIAEQDEAPNPIRGPRGGHERRGVLRADACAELADVGPRTASTGRRGCGRQLSSPRRATSAASEHGIPVEAAWQAACCLADALNDALLLRREAEHAAQLAEDWQRYAEETAVERDELLAWGLRVLDDNKQLRHAARSSSEEADGLYQQAKYLEDCCQHLTGQLRLCRQQAHADALAAQAAASALRSDVAGAQWLLRVADSRMRDLQAKVASQDHQLQAMHLEVAALRATLGSCHSPFYCKYGAAFLYPLC